MIGSEPREQNNGRICVSEQFYQKDIYINNNSSKQADSVSDLSNLQGTDRHENKYDQVQILVYISTGILFANISDDRWAHAICTKVSLA